MQTSNITDSIFHEAVEAINKGDIPALQNLLDPNPELITKRLDAPNEKGYSANPYLLWSVADNPIRHDKLPSNIVEVTQLIVDALKKTKDNNYQHIVDYTLDLVCTGRIPKECGVQIL